MRFEVLMNREGSLPRVEKTLVIRDKLGLHARPAARLAQAAQQFQSEITLANGDRMVNAKSILDILSLAAGHGTPLILRCTGDDARLAAEKLEEEFP
jgi:phosphocarrier protein